MAEREGFYKPLDTNILCFKALAVLPAVYAVLRNFLPSAAVSPVTPYVLWFEEKRYHGIILRVLFVKRSKLCSEQVEFAPEYARKSSQVLKTSPL